MATKTTVELIDDVDGSTKNVETVVFGVDGAQFEIDLSDKNAEKLRGVLAPFTANGRRVGGRQRRSSSSSTATAGNDSSKIREWAEANGVAVSSRGRISAEVQKAYADSNA